MLCCVKKNNTRILSLSRLILMVSHEAGLYLKRIQDVQSFTTRRLPFSL